MGGRARIRRDPVEPCSFEIVAYSTGITYASRPDGREKAWCLEHTPNHIRDNPDFSHRIIYRDELDKRDRCQTCRRLLSDVVASETAAVLA